MSDDVRPCSGPERIERRGVLWAIAVQSLAYLTIACIATWPLVRDFSTRIAGDLLDPAQTLWGMWWWRQSVASGQSPMHSDLLWWPTGASLWFQTWDIPSVLMTLPLWGVLKPAAIYNTAIVAGFVASGVGVSLLCSEVWQGPAVAGWTAGALYTFSTYHFGHATANLHIASMQWTPLSVYTLHRALRLGRGRSTVWAGIFAGLSMLTSVYHALFLLLTVAVVCGSGEVAVWRREVWRPRLVSLGIMSGVASLMCGWLIWGMCAQYRSETFVGAHNAEVFSVDVQSLFLPNAISAWSQYLPAWRSWTGSEWASSSYIGLTLLVLVMCAAAIARQSWPYIGLALAGLILSLGPHLHVGGHVYGGMLLPYGWLTTAIPILGFSGLPSRFGWLTIFGVTVASGAPLAMAARTGRWGTALTLLIGACGLVESWPHAFPTTALPASAIMESWAGQPGDWVVLDATSLSRPLINQMEHHHPIVAGYISRIPAASVDAVLRDGVLRAFFRPPLGIAGLDARVVNVDAAVERLKALKIRYVVLEPGHTAMAEGLRLPVLYEGDGMAIYLVP